MDRFIVKEPRVGAGFPQGNQMMPFSANARNSNIMTPESIYYGSYPPNFHQQPAMNIPQTMSPQMNQIHPQTMTMNSPQMQPPGQMHSMGQTHMGQNQAYSTMIPQNHVSGIDPRYLSGYGDNGPQYILAGQQQIQRNQPSMNSFGNDYQNRSFEGVERVKPKNALQNVSVKPQVMTLGGLEPSKVEEMPKIQTMAETKNIPNKNQQTFQNKFASSKKPTELDLIRNDVQMQMMTRADKLKALQKSGPRAFSGPVEKVLKWHKTLQDIGTLIIYEVVAKCVSVRPGEHSAKILVVRDDSGPAMQVVYYEIDFMLPELKPPCMIRVIGRMLSGTCRLQAFSVRAANGDDVATLPRRAAVAQHHIAKLANEYGTAKTA